MKKIILFLLCFIPIITLHCETDLSPNSKSAIVIESSTKEVLYNKNEHEKLAPASMTKMMTLLLTMEAIEEGKFTYDSLVTISENASNMGGSQVYLEANSQIKLGELIKAVTIASANDGAVALAEFIGGTQENFVDMMNKKAYELGLQNTNFKNPHGLDEENHYSTAYDLAIIASELVKYDDILKYSNTYEDYFEHPNGKKIWLVNTNSLVKYYDAMDGLKTGYTEEAKYCLTGTMEKNGMRLISVVMGDETVEKRNSDTISMMESIYSNYSLNTIISNNKKLGTTYIDKSKNKFYDYYLKDNVNIIFDKNTKEVDYTYDIVLNKNLTAPIKKNEKIGKLVLNYQNQKLEYDLVIKENIKKASYFRSFYNNFKDIVSGNINSLNK